MHTEADIYKAVYFKIPELRSPDWPGVTSSPLKGTKFSLVKFSDQSSLYINTTSGEVLDPEQVSWDFFELFAPAVVKWLQATPVKDWPQALRNAYGQAAAKDSFAATIWEECCLALRAK